MNVVIFNTYYLYHFFTSFNVVFVPVIGKYCFEKPFDYIFGKKLLFDIGTPNFLQSIVLELLFSISLRFTVELNVCFTNPLVWTKNYLFGSFIGLIRTEDLLLVTFLSSPFTLGSSSSSDSLPKLTSSSVSQS